MKVSAPAASAPSSLIVSDAQAAFDPRELPVKEYLEYIGGTDFGLLNRIVIAESGWRIDAQNKHSTASGLFQFLNSTFKSQCIDKYGFAESMTQKNDPYIQMDCAVRMIKDGGLSHWKASEHAWKK